MNDMPLSGNERTFARIFVEGDTDDALDIAEDSLEKKKLAPKEINLFLCLILRKSCNF